jgi:radical SAM family uncharacterized protein
MSTRRLIEKTRARLQREIGTTYKSHVGKLRVALAFPSTYYVGMSNLGFQIVYRILNERDDVVCERVFLPDQADLEELQRTGAPLVTMESQTPVREFDILAYSLSYELDYPNVIRILSLCGLDPLSERRTPLVHAPLVIAGGPAATFNPEPLASFIDAFVIGEGEVIIPGLIDCVAENQGNEPDETLRRLAHVDGVYVPRFYQPEYNPDGTIREMRVLGDAPAKVERRYLPELDSYPAVSGILTPETEFSNMALAEVARGCGRHCRFCVAGYAFLPPRSRSAESVLGGLARLEESGGGTPRVGLLSASVFDHPSSKLICESLVEAERLFSISSTRADTLDRDIVEALRKGGHETLTIAPEAGTDRLRRAINKSMTDEDVYRAANLAWDGGFKRLKLYFMIGLPTETPEDLEGIISLVKGIAGLHAWGRIGVSASCFVPKPWTPFQWVSLEDEKVLSKKVSHLRSALRGVKRVQVAGESAREAVVQGVLSRGDRRLRDSLLSFSTDNPSWNAAFRQGAVDTAFFAQRHRHKDEILPWSHIDLGVDVEYLWREYQRAIESAGTPPCARGICKKCGVCR